MGVRLSPTGQFNDPSDSDRLTTYSFAIKQLNKLGLAYLHFVEKFPGIEQSEEDRSILRALIDLWDGFYVANGGYQKDDGEAVIADGRADAVAYGRVFLANPDLPRRLKLGAALNKPNPNTFYGGGAEGYVDYPVLEEA